MKVFWNSSYNALTHYWAWRKKSGASCFIYIGPGDEHVDDNLIQDFSQISGEFTVSLA